MKWWVDKFIPVALGSAVALLLFLCMLYLSLAVLQEILHLIKGMF